MARLRALLALLLSAWAASLGCGSSDGGPNDGGSGSPDGTWSVEVAISSCYSFTGTGVITVSGGSFSGRLFGYCAVATNGATRLEPSSGCAGDETEEVTIDGTFSAGQVSGNLTLTGGACNGGNGFEGFLSSSSAATAGDAWGTLTFTKESNSGSDGGPVGRCTEPADAGAACTALTNGGSAVSVMPVATAVGASSDNQKGGSISCGTYVLTQVHLYVGTGGSSSPPGVTIQSTLWVSAGNYQLVINESDGSGEAHSSGTYSTSAGSVGIDLQPSCGEIPQGFLTPGFTSYSSDVAGTLILYGEANYGTPPVGGVAAWTFAALTNH